MVQEHINFPGEAKCTRTHQFPGELSQNSARTHTIFQEILSKILLEHIRFSRGKKYHKNRSNFPGERSQNFVRTDTILQETIPLRTDILENCLVGCFRVNYHSSFP